MGIRSCFRFCHLCGQKLLKKFETCLRCTSCSHVHEKSQLNLPVPDWAMNEYKIISKEFDYQMSRLEGGKVG